MLMRESSLFILLMQCIKTDIKSCEIVSLENFNNAKVFQLNDSSMTNLWLSRLRNFLDSISLKRFSRKNVKYSYTRKTGEDNLCTAETFFSLRHKERTHSKTLNVATFDFKTLDDFWSVTQKSITTPGTYPT